MIFYISDIHFGHSNVLELSGRPFIAIEEHDDFIIDVWNATISDNDDVYIIGDFAYRNKIGIEVYLKKLRGRKHLIIGNHDLQFLNKANSAYEYFSSINQMTMIKDGEEHVVLCHYPMAEWSGYFRGWYHVHGHIHNAKNNPAFKFLRNEPKALNAGVDINNFKPVTLRELICNNEMFKS